MAPRSKILSYPPAVAEWLSDERAPGSVRAPPSGRSLPLGYGQNRASRARIALGLAPNPWRPPDTPDDPPDA